MTPAARVQAAIEILAALANTAQPADRYLRDWFRTRRFPGARDRAAVAERVYDVFRHRASYAWRMGSEDPRALVIASVLAAGGRAEIDQIFAGSNYGPAQLDEAEESAVASTPQGPPPLAVVGEFPAWLEPELVRSFGGRLLDEMQAMLSRAPVDLRVNTLKSTRDDVLRELRSLALSAEPAPIAPYGIRLGSAAGLHVLQNTELFRAGAFEFQDEASQIVARLVDAQPGERILDLAAGAGGKTIAVAADMKNSGEIVAFDADPERMKPLATRTCRAGVTIIRALASHAEISARADFDAVLVDTPCSGSGTWRRNPDARWRLTPAALDRLIAVQGAILDDAARLVRSGGRLIYATCSLFRCENEDAVERFLSRERAFRRVDVESVWSRLFSAALPRRTGHDFRASPFATGTDGFFASIMVRQN